MAFFQFRQNNSYGVFTVNNTVCHRLFIEADTHSEAIRKAEELGCYWDGVCAGIDCPCCGDRWDNWDDRPVETDDIEAHAQNLADSFGWTSPDARIFYKNGRVSEIYSGGVMER